MNMGISDAFDLGWKMASIRKGQAMPGLLTSYESERKPVAIRNVEHSGVDFGVHGPLKEILAGGGGMKKKKKRIEITLKEVTAEGIK
jgi:FAD-dependent monooxygenase